MREALESLCRGEDLTRSQAMEIFGRLIAGRLSEVEMAALLVALKAKGEAAVEIAGAADALREAALGFPVGGLDVVDTCGTGGDGAGTINVSTAAALIVAEAGLHVAKHGNRAISSRCGSADVLELCGVRVDAEPEASLRALREVGVCFLFAPQYHPGIAQVMPVRRQLGVRTIFNLLGPLVNPARPRFQVVGVYDARLCGTMAETLGLLGCERALVVHGSGLDEIAVHGSTQAALWTDGRLETTTLEPESMGVERWSRAALAGGSPEWNAAWLRKLLSGAGEEAHRQIVCVNAGALLWLVGRVDSMLEGTRAAREILASGKALARLDRWAEISHGS